MTALPSSAEEWVVWLGLQASLWAYGLRSIGIYRLYRRRIEDAVSNLHRYAWGWLLLFLVCILLLLASFLVVDLLMVTGIPLVAFNSFISISLTASILYLGWSGLLRLDYLSPAVNDRAAAPAAVSPAREAGEWKELFAEIQASVRSSALFRSPELTLPELADALGYSRTELSRIINLGGEMNFYDFVNKLRVEEVQARMRDKAGAGSILDLAFDSGFNTKSTFHASFKKWTGTTPSLYRKRMTESAS